MINFIVTALVAATSLTASPVSVTNADVKIDNKIAVVEQAPQLRAQPRIADVREVRTMYVTAYSSTPEETDDTPFITASGATVHDGIVATNELPLKTKIRIPALYGDKVFIVEDRMNERMKNKVDIWMATKEQAIRFGIKRVEIHVL